MPDREHEILVRIDRDMNDHERALVKESILQVLAGSDYVGDYEIEIGSGYEAPD